MIKVHCSIRCPVILSPAWVDCRTYLHMWVSLSILVTALVRSNKKKAVDARKFIVGTPQSLGRLEMQVDFRRVAADALDMMVNILKH